MVKNKILVVYNTCGIDGDNTEWYIACLESLLNQNFDEFKVVMSSCLNSEKCMQAVSKKFKGEISYCYHQEPHTVNITFNKTVQECIKNFGEFEQYVYIDSGCTFGENRDILSRAYKSMKEHDYGMLSLQVDTDEALHAIDPSLLYESKEIQIKEKDLVIPLGKACNGHVIFISNELLKNYNNKPWPDVFAAHCTESTFTFICSGISKKWAILKDIKIEHLKALDGPSQSNTHWSRKHGNPWNNLLYDRDARDFINDPEAIESGLGYAESENIMMHKEEAYDKNGYPKHPEELRKNINKYFFLNEEELNYNNIKCRFITKVVAQKQ